MQPSTSQAEGVAEEDDEEVIEDQLRRGRQDLEAIVCALTCDTCDGIG